MWSSRCSELQYKEVASLKIREDQCVHVLCYVNGCFEQHHKLLDVLADSWDCFEYFWCSSSICSVIPLSFWGQLSLLQIRSLIWKESCVWKDKDNPQIWPRFKIIFPFLCIPFLSLFQATSGNRAADLWAWGIPSSHSDNVWIAQCFYL